MAKGWLSSYAFFASPLWTSYDLTLKVKLGLISAWSKSLV